MEIPTGVCVRVICVLWSVICLLGTAGKRAGGKGLAGLSGEVTYAGWDLPCFVSVVEEHYFVGAHSGLPVGCAHCQTQTFMYDGGKVW